MNHFFKLKVFRVKIGSHDQPNNIRILNQHWATLLRALCGSPGKPGAGPGCLRILFPFTPSFLTLPCGEQGIETPLVAVPGSSEKN